MASTLDQLRAAGTAIVIDSGEIEKIRAFTPLDATTNPSLIYAAAGKPEYAALVADAVAHAKANAVGEVEQLALALDKLAINFGVEISKLVPGYVSTEVDARLSFEFEANVTRARRIIALYAAAGVPKSRVLIKLASTWEGIQAAAVLEAEGIACNLTLLFSYAQAVACAQARVTLISPFVGRIMDWHKAKAGGKDFAPSDDPGVHSVRKIYAYYKKAGVKTIIMGASFRNTGEIVELSGCDRLTIGPALLEQLRASTDPAPPRLTPEAAAADEGAPAHVLTMSESEFRWALNEDACATDKLAEGIRGFAADLRKLEAMLTPLLHA